MKKTYYVNLTTREITDTPYGNEQPFVIEASDAEIELLRKKMDNMYEEDLLSFVRAHIPFQPYHVNNPSDQFDQEFMEAYEMIYQLGDDETKAKIMEMGILKE